MADRVADTPVVYPAGVDAETQQQLNAQGEAQKKKEQEARDAALWQQGNTVYGHGSIGRSLAVGGMNSGSDIAQGLAQLSNAGALGPMAAGFGPMALGIGAAVDAGTQVIAGAFRGKKEAAEMGGKAIKQVASNDGLGLLQTGVEATAKGFEKRPVVGGMVADGLRDLLARCREPMTGVPPSAEVLAATVHEFRVKAARIREVAEADEAVAVAVPAGARNDPAAYRPVFTRMAIHAVASVKRKVRKLGKGDDANTEAEVSVKW